MTTIISTLVETPDGEAPTVNLYATEVEALEDLVTRFANFEDDVEPRDPAEWIVWAVECGGYVIYISEHDVPAGIEVDGSRVE